MQMVTEEHTSQKQMAIVERFDGFMNYMYPIALNIPRAHYVARDRYITHTLRAKAWLRYMDDTVIFAHSREALAVIQHGLKWFCEVRMGLVFSKWSIGPVTQGIDWLGYRVWPTHKLLRRRSVIAAKRKIVRYRRIADGLALSRFVASWRGHAQWANSFNLLNKLGVA